MVNVKLEYFDSGIMQIFIFRSQALRASDSLEDCPTLYSVVILALPGYELKTKGR
jgi:hypothetical protein